MSLSDEALHEISQSSRGLVVRWEYSWPLQALLARKKLGDLGYET